MLGAKAHMGPITNLWHQAEGSYVTKWYKMQVAPLQTNKNTMIIQSTMDYLQISIPVCDICEASIRILGPYFKSSYMGQECLGKLSLEMNFCSSLALHGDPIWSSPVTRTILLKVTGSKSRRTIPKITLATQGTGNKILKVGGIKDFLPAVRDSTRPVSVYMCICEATYLCYTSQYVFIDTSLMWHIFDLCMCVHAATLAHFSL